MDGLNSVIAGMSFAQAYVQGKLTTTGAVLKCVSNTDVLLSVPVVKTLPFCSRAAASSELNRVACVTILGMDAGAVQRASRSGSSLVEFAVNLYMLSHTQKDLQEPLFKKACDKIKKAAIGHAKNGERSFSMGFIGKGNGHVVHKKIKGLIDKLVFSRPDTFTAAAVVTNRMFLHNWLPYVREQ